MPATANLQNYGVVQAVDGQTIASTGSYTSGWFPIGNVTSFSFWCKSTSATGTADVKIDFDQCPLTSAPATTDPYVTTEIDASDTGEAWSEYVNTTVNAIVAKWGRVKVTGVNANPADTVSTVYVSMR